jgi:hypothetical protein
VGRVLLVAGADWQGVADPWVAVVNKPPRSATNMTFMGSPPVTAEEWAERVRIAAETRENRKAGEAKRSQRAAGKIGGRPKRDDAHCIALAEDFLWRRAKNTIISDTALMTKIGKAYAHGKTTAYKNIKRGLELLARKKTVRERL